MSFYRAKLGDEVLTQIKDYVAAHLDEPIQVVMLARLAGYSLFHFSRMFTQSVGMPPHRYIVLLRLERAVELARDENLRLAEIAARTGFADQSHLSRWIRRVYGMPLTQLMAGRAK
jgi:AraC family transcriptional regulator